MSLQHRGNATPLLAVPRQTLGPPPRALDTTTVDALRPSRPSWLSGEDVLLRTVTQFDEILRTGEITWGYVVQANRLLWTRGDSPAAAMLVHGASSREDPPLLRLAEVARRLARLQPQGPLAPGWDDIARTVEDQSGRPLRVALPTSLTWGLSLELSAVLVVPQYLPVPLLQSPFFPMLLPPGPLPGTVLPSMFWGEALTSAWYDWSVE